MSEDMRQLLAEVDRILQSPYRVAFKNLFATLSNTSQNALHLWARGHPCQIDGLATALLDGDDLTPYSLEIIRILSCVTPFRDAILERRPTLFNSLLTHATTSDPGFCNYATICTALLSAPLNIPEPAVLATFLSRVLDRAVASPSADSIRPIYTILCGLTPDWLDGLPIDIIMHLQDQLTKLIVVPGSEHHSANLICLAVLAKLASMKTETFPSSKRSLLADHRSSSLNSSLNKGALVRRSVDRYSSARQFFTAKRSAKTVGLVTLKAIQACSPDCPLTEAIESLEISEVILGTISNCEKISWLEKNGLVIQRLYHRLSRKGIAAEVKCAALSFIAELTEGESFPAELITTLQGLLNTSISFRKAGKAVEIFAGQLTEPMISIVINDLLELACLEVIPSLESLVRLENAMVLTLSLGVQIQSSPSLRQAVLHSISTDQLSKPLDRFISLVAPVSCSNMHGQADICPHSYQQTKLNLHRGICDLFLKTILAEIRGQVRIDAFVATALLDKQMSLLTVSRSCDFYGPKTLAPVIPPINSNEAAQRAGSHDWRNMLRESILRATESQFESIVRTVGGVCQDLELRCENVERPLREEQTKSNDLSLKLNASEAALRALESQAQERLLTIEGLETEKAMLTAQAQAAEQREQSLSHSHDILRQEFDEAKKVAVDAAETAEEALKQQELAHLASLTGKDEMYDEQTSIIKELEDRVTILAGELSQMKARENEATSRIAVLQDEALEQTDALKEAKGNVRCLEADVHEKSEALETLTGLAACRQTEIDRLVDQESILLIEQRDLACKLKAAEEHCELLKEEVNAKTKQFENQQTDLRLSHEKFVSLRAEEFEQQHNLYEATIHKLRARLAKADGDSALATKQSGQRISRLEKEIHLLRHEQERRAKEFAEAQDLSSKLMAVMGMKQNPPASPNPPTAGAINSSEFQSGQTPFNPSFDSQITRSSGSSTSSTKGPTPKRTRTQRKSKSPMFHRVKIASASTSLGKSTRASAFKGRLPLRNLGEGTQIGQKFSPSKPSQEKQNWNQINREDEKENVDLDYNVNLDEENFDDSHVFTSSYQHQLSEWRQRKTQE